MAENLYTQLRHAKFRGPTTSDDYNSRIEELYKDLVYLYNRVGLADEDLFRAYKRLVKDHFSLMQIVAWLEERIAALEALETSLSFYSTTQIDVDRFDDTQYEIPSVSRCYSDDGHGLITLPKIETSSLSKLKFVNSDGSVTVPSTFETLVNGDDSTADSPTAIIDTSDPYFAVINQTGKVWERNVVVNTPNGEGAITNLYVRLPTDLSVTADSNVIQLHAYPMMGADILEVSYSTDTDVSLNDTDNYYPLNRDVIYSGNDNAVGWIAPGAWDGDEIVNAGPKTFYFDPQPITAIKVKLRQTHYFAEADKTVYSYGLSRLDVRHDKFLDTGKTIIRFDAPEGELINEVTGVTPQIWNTSEGQLDDVFSYRTIWETSDDSGVYVTNQVEPTSHVWIEVTLNKSLGKGTPALSGLIVEYS